MTSPKGGPPDSYADFTAVVKRVHDSLQLRDYVTSIALFADDDGARRLEIRVVPETPVAARAQIDREAREAVEHSAFAGIKLTPAFTPDAEDQYTPASGAATSGDNALPVATTPEIRAGMSAAARLDCADQGTAGWLFVLNRSFAFMSNWHILCALGNASNKDADIWIECRDNPSPRAGLLHFVPLDPKGANRMDFALAALRDPSLARGGMDGCDDPAPVDLYRDALQPGGSRLFRAVGQASGCRSGRRLVGTIAVRLFDTYLLEDQLLFEKIAGTGDSGAAVVDEQTNTVAGLFFMHNQTHSIASPVGPLLKPLWRKIGEQSTPSGPIPIFEGSLP